MMFRLIMVVFFSLTALSLFTFQGIEGVKAFLEIIKTTKSH
ncbi:hypothetical protein AJ85_04405 [Alkalihalobacillus alcalophilus ATCC 27647 = CGMCC 1.3604]|uniref:Uncharacterized protein n=1 Tax=Alkalihalobacillus alcalophilus ATCC 27647 = CGMCC 1.3604 TaxID=1218173 RepID=A0A4S4K1N9_ALKAL|nr:hypothetical protein AJ85_04405 [Alkalihalobacillus alcalophilus ATCC 27647 = CGMCC 1.3604]